MNRVPKIVFLDIDGTIVKHQYIEKSAKLAIQKLQSRGIPVVLCTGRSKLHTEQIQNELDIHTAVFYNGGLTMLEGEIIDSNPLQRNVVQKVIDFTTDFSLPLIMHSVRQAITFKDFPNRYQPIIDAFDFPPLKKISDFEWRAHEEDIYQVNVFMERTWDQKSQNLFPECVLYRWDPHAVDLQKRGCDKSVGASRLLQAMNITHADAVHIGDGGNDTGMFRTMGMSVAMGNASAEVQAEAKLVTTAVDDNGVENALRKLGLI